MSRKLVSIEQLQRIEGAMKNAPRVDAPLTIGETIKRLSGSIKQMRTKGYDWQKIAGILRENGVSVSADTLRRYVAPRRHGGGKKAA